jgi:glutamate-1-semialdehyde 2,1-aminomutase
MSVTLSSQPCLSHEEDLEFFQRELASFVPPRVYDAHTHLWQEAHSPFRIPGFSGDVDFDQYKALMADLHPGRQTAALGLAFGHPSRPRSDVVASNQWIATAVANDRDFRGEFFVRPDDDPDWVRQEVRRLRLHGLKCYHTFAKTSPTWEADIPDFLPEPLVRVAHEENWCITLHIVKSRALADESNLHWIQHYCKTYPQIKLILAHSGRGFQPAHNLAGLPKLRGLDNLYFDTSANCEPIAHQAIIRIMGHRRLLYGTDLPVSHMRGRSLSAADSFLWLYEDTPVWGQPPLHTRPVLIGLEHLRSLKWACWAEKLTDSQVEDIFWNNAAQVLQM